MPPRTLVIANPRSRGGSTGRRWAQLEQKLRSTLGALEVESTHKPRDAERIAREGVRAGVERLVVAGGDGTLSEVVTGLMAAGLAGYAEVGVLPLGSGGDFPRSLGIPPSLDEALQRIAVGKPCPLDAGRVVYRDRSGREATRYFANVASLGVSARVVELVNRGPKLLGGGISYLYGTLRALIAHRSLPVSLRLDGDQIFEGPLALAAAANGRYFGGGMQVAPQARLDDGLMDLVVVCGISRARLVAKLPKIYRGTHLDDAVVRLHRGRLLEAEALQGTVWLEADGEPLGTLPARVEILPGALTLIGAAT